MTNPRPGRTPVDRLTDPALQPLVDELARRFSSGQVPVRITLPALGDAGLARVADLLGLDRYPAQGRPIAVARLAAAFGAADVEGLRDAIAALRGPLGDRRSERAEARAARQALWAHVERAAAELDLLAGGDGADTWTRHLVEAGVPGGDVTAHQQRVDHALSCLRRLPAASPVTLAGLAVDVTGTAHGLDPGRRLTRMVLDALAVAFDLPVPADAESARLLWERAGIVADPVSSTVLSVGLRPPGDDTLATFLRAASDEAEPVVLTLHQLQRRPLVHRPPGGVAFVVENPSLVTDVIGCWDGPPILCSSGRPSMAVVSIVRHLVEAGTTVRQHADFDGAGIDIIRWLSARAGTEPWHMTADDYTAAVAHRPTTELRGLVGETRWDPELGPRMEAAGRALHEEAIRADLLDAIRSSGWT